MIPPTRSYPGDADDPARTRPHPAHETLPAADPGRAPVAGPGGYELLDLLGQGGTGVVYKARDTRLNRVVALKMLLGGYYLDPVARVRFLIEAEAIAQLQHPNVVRVYEFGEHAGQPFLALEFVDGGTLSAALRRRGRFAPADAAGLVARLADAMAAAHAAGVVHRDLKPPNVLLTAAGEPKVVDFGLAKVAGSDVTATNAVLGTPHYMAPEQAAGKVREVGTAADVYALGVILYELLTGKTPFAGDTSLEVLRQVLTADPARPRAADPHIPKDLETVCLKCLEKAPAARYATAAALRDDLLAYLDRRPIAARPVGAVERGAKWARRHPGRAAALAAAALAAVGVVVGVNEADRRRAARDRSARAGALVQALAAADPAAVPQLVADLADYRDDAGPRLRALAAEPVGTMPGLHARLALLDEDPGLAADVAGYLPDCRPGELLPARRLLAPHAAAAAPPLWVVLADPAEAPGRRLRAAAALAGLAPTDSRWPTVAPAVAALAAGEAGLDAAVWAEALDPVGPALRPALAGRYHDARERIEGGRLSGSELAAEAAGLDVTARLLARYAAGRPADLAALAAAADARHYPLFAPALRADRAAARDALRAALAGPDPGFGGPLPVSLAAVAGVPAGLAPPAAAAAADRRAWRRANVVAALLTLDPGDDLWREFRHAPDPSARSYLVHRAAGAGLDPLALARRFDAEPDASARRALVLALGEYDPAAVPAADRDRLADRLLAAYRDAPDPGLCAAAGWVLRGRWGRGGDADRIDAELAGRPRDPRKGWYADRRGRRYAVVRGPAAFVMGSPPGEAGRMGDLEAAHRVEIPRTFAVGVTEVTAAEFLRFRPGYGWLTRFNPDPGGPAISVSWFEAAAYCNWLSREEGLPPDQWCYEPDPADPGRPRPKPGHLRLSGYRLPTEAEWEYAARAGAGTARHFGAGDRLLPRYAWFLAGGVEQARPVGRLKPNDLGLFDTLGNAAEWVADPPLDYAPAGPRDDDDRRVRPDPNDADRVCRGAQFNTFSTPNLRSAYRVGDRPVSHDVFHGFRVARTLPD